MRVQDTQWGETWGGVVHVGGAFSIQNTIVFAAIHRQSLLSMHPNPFFHPSFLSLCHIAGKQETNNCKHLLPAVIHLHRKTNCDPQECSFLSHQLYYIISCVTSCLLFLTKCSLDCRWARQGFLLVKSLVVCNSRVTAQSHSANHITTLKFPTQDNQLLSVNGTMIWRFWKSSSVHLPWAMSAKRPHQQLPREVAKVLLSWVNWSF